MKGKERNKIPFIVVCMCVGLLLTGGFFDSSVAGIGVAIIGCLFVMLISGAEFYRRDKRLIFGAPGAVLCVAIVVSFWAIDYMENFMGVMRLIVICLWMYLVRSRREWEISLAKEFVPTLGCISVGISLISLLVPSWTGMFWENSRMSGFFQYANTNGLFFAIGMMLLIYRIQKEEKRIKDIVEFFVLLMGLLLSGSRSVLLLFAVWGVLYAIQTKAFRKPFLIGSAIMLVLGGIYVSMTGNMSNVGRIFTIFTSNSTLWGRLLYYRDAILLLCRKFWGLGRLGYYYSQGTFQSGVYRIKFVHNDMLQLALDYGVLALSLVGIFLVWQLFRGKQSKEDKGVLAFILLASLLDFHCQYLLIVMIACLFLDYGECIKEKKAEMKENYILLPIFLMMFLYIGIATGSSKAGNQGLALSMLPDYTSAQEKVLLNCVGTVDSYELATRLIEKNPYNLTAYLVRGYFYGTQFCVADFIADWDRMLELDPYNVEYYVQYEQMLANMEHELLVSESEDDDLKTEIELLRTRKEALKSQLMAVQERTSSLAYKIKDEPVFSYER